MAVMDGPLEPPASAPSSVADVPDDPAFVNFFSSALNVGNAPTAVIAGQPFQSSLVPTLLAPAVPSPAAPALQVPSPPLPAPSTETMSSNSRVTNLVKPSFFIPPPSSSTPMVPPPVTSSIPTAPPLHPPVNLQRPYGAPILQPFPPPTPPLSLTPISVPTANHVPVLTRDKVREALLVLVQDNQFIEAVHRVLQNVDLS